jgi:hypothetical protein
MSNYEVFGVLPRLWSYLLKAPVYYRGYGLC